MRILKQVVCGYLALCMALAGAVGVSPTLHRLIEHGGLAPAHSHLVSFRIEQPKRLTYRELLVHHGRAFALPSFSLGRFWHGIAHVLEVPAHSEASHGGKNAPGHEHHSLAQMMASGFAEQPLDVVVLESICFFRFVESVPAESFVWQARFELQGSGRGPPLVS